MECRKLKLPHPFKISVESKSKTMVYRASSYVEGQYTFYVDSYIILQFAGVPGDPAAEKSGSLPHASQHSYWIQTLRCEDVEVYRNYNGTSPGQMKSWLKSRYHEQSLIWSAGPHPSRPGLMGRTYTGKPSSPSSNPGASSRTISPGGCPQSCIFCIRSTTFWKSLGVVSYTWQSCLIYSYCLV